MPWLLIEWSNIIENSVSLGIHYNGADRFKKNTYVSCSMNEYKLLLDFALLRKGVYNKEKDICVTLSTIYD